MSISRIIIAGDCIWQQEKHISAIDGVHMVRYGYTGGFWLYPTYMEISSDMSGDLQALEISYFDNLISFSELLDKIIILCFKHYPAFELNLFYSNLKQKQISEHKLRPLSSQKFNNIRILPVTNFYSYLNPKQYPQLSCPKSINKNHFPLP